MHSDWFSEVQYELLHTCRDICASWTHPIPTLSPYLFTSTSLHFLSFFSASTYMYNSLLCNSHYVIICTIKVDSDHLQVVHYNSIIHQMWWEKSTYVSITCWQADAKKRKLRQTLGMSTFVASQTGLPWSRDSASANSSRHASTLSAIVLRYLARSAGDVLLQLQKCEQHIMSQWAEPQGHTVVSSYVWVYLMFVTHVSQRLLQATMYRNWRVQSRHNAPIHVSWT